jgi:O-antigen ligase
MVDGMGARVKRYFIPALVGFAPLVTFLMTWDVASYGTLSSVIRALSLPELAAELGTVAIAFVEGMLPWLRRLRPPRYALAAIVALVAIALGTIAIAPDQSSALFKTFFWITHLAFGISVAFLCGNLFEAKDLVRAYLIGFLSFTAAFALFAGTSFHRPLDWTRDLPAVVHIRHLGIYATAVIGLCVGVMATATGRQAWIGACLVAASGFALALWTGARGPAIAIGVTVAAGLVVAPAIRRFKAWGGACLGFVIGLLAVYWLPVPADNMGFARTVAATTQSGDVGTGRLDLWRGVIHAIQRQPLFGYGEGQMPAVAHFADMQQPHNLILQILLAWGIAGLLCCLALAFWFVPRAITTVRRDEANLLAPFLAMVALVALSMIDAALYHILPLSIFAACAGMIVAGQRNTANT